MGLELEILILLFLVALSAFFSGTETAFTSLSDIRLQHLAETKKKGIRLVRRLRENNQRLLITILIGNNLVNIAASSIATSLAMGAFGDAGVGIAVGVMTFLILVFGEITPKTIAMANNEWIAIRTAPLLRVMQLVFYPVIRLLESIATLTARPVQGDDSPVLTEDEIKTVVSMGEVLGEVEEDERIMIHNIFRFSDLQADEIMTDRTLIFSLPAEKTAEEVASEIVKRGFSRVPVYEENQDQMVGILYARDVLQAMIQDREDTPVKDLARPAMFVPQTILVDDLLREFQSKKVHMALVVDEHGGVSGLVTIEDLLEEIVGDIVDETDREPPRIKKTGKDKALVMGQTEVEEVNEKLDLAIDVEQDYETISGFVLESLRRIPEAGEELDLGDFFIRVTKADPQRIIEVEIEKKPKESS